MKAAIYCAIIILNYASHLTCHAQGTLFFDNRVTGIVDVKFTDFLTQQPVPGHWFGQLFLVNTERTAVTPLYPVTPFRSDSFFALGYVVPTIVTVPNSAPGNEVRIQMGAFDNPNYLAATAFVSSDVFTVKLGGGSEPPAYLTGLTKAGYYGPLASVIPEPRTISLVLVGGALAWLGRRCFLRH